MKSKRLVKGEIGDYNIGSKLRDALWTAEMEDLLVEELEEIPVIYSREFCRKMTEYQKLAAGNMHSYYRIGRECYGAAALLILTATLSFMTYGTTYASYQSWIAYRMRDYGTHSTMEYDLTGETVPQFIEEQYVLGIVPEGYVLSGSYGYDREGTMHCTQIFQDAEGNLLSFGQNVIIPGELGRYNTENAIVTDVVVGGNAGVYIENEELGIHQLIWNDGRYQYELFAYTLSGETLTELAESIIEK